MFSGLNQMGNSKFYNRRQSCRSSIQKARRRLPAACVAERYTRDLSKYVSALTFVYCTTELARLPDARPGVRLRQLTFTSTTRLERRKAPKAITTASTMES